MQIKVIDTNPVIRKKIGEAMVEKIKRRFDSSIRKSQKQIQQLLEDDLLNSDTYKSLVSGDLRAELGLDESSVSNLTANIGFLFSLEEYYYDGLSSPRPTDKGITYARGISIEVDPDLDFFSYYTAKGEFIPWLDWLINGEGQTFSPNYKVYRKDGKGRSRMAVMIKSEGDSYTVDSRYSGTINDNWITRIIIKNKQKIEDIVRTNAEKR